ncbi:hypothetical protein ABMA27_010420 [Loxostege sticticalis]|uniref:XRCC4 N-terminal domain-containing protein n=1 Tax=Loxostege sticticalis TaxID=481309 RepID=A0ABR3H5P3_LOXSC
MDIDESITVTKIHLQDGRGYLLVGWQPKSFEMNLYLKDKLWKGRFSQNRLSGFSRNLNLSEKDYYDKVKRCLSQERDDYCYELKSGFFYWKRKYKNSVIMEGFLPMELDTSPPNTRPDLFEITIYLNNYLKRKLKDLKQKYETVKKDYTKCLKDTEKFLNLKIGMEKTLCDKFLNLLTLK